MKHTISAFACAVVAACALTAGCYGYESKTTTPSSPTATVDSLIGTWKSTSSGVIPSASSCTDFTWTPTQQSATSASGSFTASCAGGLHFTGTASGTLSGGTVSWQAQAIGSTAEISSCAITLTGTAELGTNSIRVPYSGNTCLGPVSGVEILNKK